MDKELCEKDKAVLRCIFDPTVTIGDVTDEGDQFIESDEELTAAEQESKTLGSRGILLAEQGKLAEALELLDQAVSAAPEFAAAYNDRAQLLRLMKRDDEAITDLDRAIDLTVGRRNRARALALCQRGVVLRGRGRDQDARRDFAAAAKMGSQFARKQVVELNPYAALCNQMLSQVMKGETNIQL